MAPDKSQEEEPMTEEERIMLQQLDEAAAKEVSVDVHPLDLKSFPPPKVEKKVQIDPNLNLNMILDVPVDIHVELGSTQVSIREVLSIGPGAILELDRLAGSPADIIVNGKLIGQGDIVIVNDSFGIRITKLVDPEERVDSL